MLFNILALISVLICLSLLKRFTAIFPSLVACIIRWKESVNLEASVKLSNDRDKLAFAMLMPFCLVADRFCLYEPKFLSGFDGNMKLAITIGIFLVYFMLRTIAAKFYRPKGRSSKCYKIADKSALTFFIILTLILLAMGGVMTFMDVEPAMIKSAMLWVSAGIYALSLLRKTQIFVSGCSIFTAFLYLCALEIFPTGILVVSALIF
ncbi:MAG: DUF4271 domain-containing protein [Bacteroidales bacterium]|nr:DUF4271 domain-containing protein [Bacteroidales bacterium]